MCAQREERYGRQVLAEDFLEKGLYPMETLKFTAYLAETTGSQQKSTAVVTL